MLRGEWFFNTHAVVVVLFRDASVQQLLAVISSSMGAKGISDWRLAIGDYPNRGLSIASQVSSDCEFCVHFGLAFISVHWSCRKL